ncbi:unnamed protein product [Rotaria magnacalcarata]|uniref:F-box domain-containing protein n=1 Tax=Rotaria magnacalcarata TaxID=392030 RepID=A0A820DFL6_9BILA|nr:unnamed protein product [Rotaria magnacalcarata]CAF4231375.1 unnamed protein product [Rotaria magnacalcarata]
MSLNTRIKRKKELREEYVEQNGLIFQLPDETLISIFKNLKTDELISIAGVCKWFNRIAYDEEFWTTIDLSSKNYSNRVLLKFLRRFPRDCTEVLKISGGLVFSSAGKPPPFTEQLNSLIKTSYPNLRYLYLSRYDFHVNQNAIKHIVFLPSKLHGLYLNKCEMLTTNISPVQNFLQPPIEFCNDPARKVYFRELQKLSFENSSCLKPDSLGYLTNLCSNLVELNLNGCFRITPTNVFIQTLLKYSNTLRRLYLSETKIDDNAIHSICRKLKRLNILDIKDCQYVTENIVENLLTLRQLQKLIANDNIRNAYIQRKNKEI